jgi:hypothetical protein
VITTPAPSLELRYHRLERYSRWVAGLATIAVIVLAGALAWTVAQRSNAVADARTLADDVASAWTSHDPATASEVYAPDVAWVDIAGYRSSGIDAVRSGITMSSYLSLAVKVDGDPLVDGIRVVVPVTFIYLAGSPAVPYPIERQGLVQLELNDAGLIVSQRDLALAPVPIDEEVTAKLLDVWSKHDATRASLVYAEGVQFVDTQGYRSTGLEAIAENITMGGVIGYTLEPGDFPTIAHENLMFVPATETYVAILDGETVASKHTNDVLIRIELDAQGRIASQQNFLLNGQPAD